MYGVDDIVSNTLFNALEEVVVAVGGSSYVDDLAGLAGPVWRVCEWTLIDATSYLGSSVCLACPEMRTVVPGSFGASASRLGCARLQYEREDSKNDKDEDEPFGDRHGQSSNAACAEYCGDHCENRELDRESDQVAPQQQGINAIQVRIDWVSHAREPARLIELNNCYRIVESVG